MSLFSPFDTRYAKDLPISLSEESLVQAQVDVEIAWLESLREFGICPDFDLQKLKSAVSQITLSEIEVFERKTHHATRALVEAISDRLAKAGMVDLSKWVHVGLTSFDTVDTAQRLRIKKFLHADFLPASQKLTSTIKTIAKKHQSTPQVGRTHGQWAVPSFFGVTLMEFAFRLKRAEGKIVSMSQELCGQASGAIGGYHAASMLTDKPLELEENFLSRLNLQKDLGSLQIVSPEDQWNLASLIYAQASVVAKLANDLRHLARSEIAEISEGMEPGQVGSSTMPQKRNPWNLEHVCSLYKILQSRLQLLQIDMVTEHQRDLTNSASGRFYGEFFATAFLMTQRLQKVLSKLEVHEHNMKAHLKSAGSSVYAEAFYVALSKEGVQDAHSKVREAARESETSSKDLLQVLHSHGYLQNIKNIQDLEKIILNGVDQKFKAIESEL